MSEERTLEAEIADLAPLVRSVTDADRVDEAPPADLWARIAAEALGDETISADTATESEAETAAESVAAPRDNVRPIPLRRQRRIVTVAGALAVAAAAAVALPLTLSSGDDLRVLASAPLSNEGLAVFDRTPSGAARLVEDGGVAYLEVQVNEVPDPGTGYLELWLIDTKVQGMVSLGPYTGARRYPVPAGVDPGAYPVVDVSVEPTDGVPTHSGVSVVRGVLPDDRAS